MKCIFRAKVSLIFFLIDSVWAFNELPPPNGFQHQVVVAGETTFYGLEKTRPSVLVISTIDRPLPPEMLIDQALQKVYLEGIKKILTTKKNKVKNFSLQSISETKIGKKRGLLYSYTFSEGKEDLAIQAQTLLLEWTKQEALSVDFSSLTTNSKTAWEASLKSLRALVEREDR